MCRVDDRIVGMRKCREKGGFTERNAAGTDQVSDDTCGRLADCQSQRPPYRRLDAQGVAKAKLNIPNSPVLKGIRIYSAYVTLKATAPSGISSISNSFMFSIQ